MSRRMKDLLRENYRFGRMCEDSGNEGISD